MITDRSKYEGQLSKLRSYLGYESANGWLNSGEFEDAGVHRFALMQAAEEMNVLGAFAWKADTAKGALVVPLVYVAMATDRSDAKKIHRKVWSQGLVPFLIILTPVEIIYRDGFHFSSSNWEESVSPISWSDAAFSDDIGDQPRVNDLWEIRASRLRTSLFWRDRAIEVSGRVDQCLLLGLEALSDELIHPIKDRKPLSARAANGLIGRLLYVLFLVDRGIVNQQWLSERGHKGISLNDSSLDWPAHSAWALFKDLDKVFNGSIFPLGAEDREQIGSEHINLIRMVMRHGARLNSYGEVQLGFIDVDLGVMRIETLSAVYEQFLENIRSGERRKQGAYYTPPFLVDLILNRVEESLALDDGVTVLDPSAGSGVFLVGAYRRILERSRARSPDKSMDLDEVRGLLQRNIFGIERNVDACHVAAFSLYLTMLDYVRPRDLIRVAAGEDATKLFPNLMGVNLFAVDFFSLSKELPGLPKISCVIGNPPWQTLKKLESTPAEKWMEKNPQSPIGNDQAAELFVWKALREHMHVGATLALLIPAKSFVNPTAQKFRQALMVEYTVVGAINFAHLRHRLFAGAKHACAALFVCNREPTTADWVSVYSFLSVSQPMPYKAWPWTIGRAHV